MAVNLLANVPKLDHRAVKAHIRENSAAPTRAAAEAALVILVGKYEAKYLQAAECLTQNPDSLLAFSVSSGGP